MAGPPGARVPPLMMKAESEFGVKVLPPNVNSGGEKAVGGGVIAGALFPLFSLLLMTLFVGFPPPICCFKLWSLLGNFSGSTFGGSTLGGSTLGVSTLGGSTFTGGSGRDDVTGGTREGETKTLAGTSTLTGILIVWNSSSLSVDTMVEVNFAMVAEGVTD
jgi:hypothetical protein